MTAMMGSWVMSVLLSNLTNPSYFEDEAIYCLAVSVMTTTAMVFYYSHPDQRRVRKLIELKYSNR